MVELLINHPYFVITAVCASSNSVGKSYGSVWRMETPLPEALVHMKISPCTQELHADILFSALDSSVAGTYETAYARSGYIVISNSRNHRMDPTVPLLIPEVNPEHIQLLSQQQTKGKIITNPNCVVAGVALALKPLDHHFGVRTVSVATLQAASGAGFRGVDNLIDNVIPDIDGEEQKIESEPNKILGSLTENGIKAHPMTISAHCNRVPVSDGHTACLTVTFDKQPEKDEILSAWKHWPTLDLPSAPMRLFYLADEPPQPKPHRMREKGMALSIGKLRPCPLGGWKFVILVHNTIRGAAGASILNAEWLLHQKVFKL